MPGQTKSAVDILLVESFKELVLKRPIEKITIKEITDKAGVIRPTFYNHFQDKYELLEWIIRTDLIEPMRPLIQNGLSDQALLFVFTGVQNDMEFYARARRLEGQNSFESIVTNCIQDTLLETFGVKHFGDKMVRGLTPELLSMYYAKAMCFLVLSWIDSGLKATPQEMADIYKYLVNHSVEEALGELDLGEKKHDFDRN